MALQSAHTTTIRGHTQETAERLEKDMPVEEYPQRHLIETLKMQGLSMRQSITFNEIISRRMVKKQQMTDKLALDQAVSPHFVLVSATAVVNKELSCELIDCRTFVRQNNGRYNISIRISFFIKVVLFRPASGQHAGRQLSVTLTKKSGVER